MSWAWWEKKKAEWNKLVAYWPDLTFKQKVKNVENLVDDPVDEVKHKLHGMTILGRKFYLPSWLMRGSGKEGK